LRSLQGEICIFSKHKNYSVVCLASPCQEIPPLSGGNVSAADKRGPLRGEREVSVALATDGGVVVLIQKRLPPSQPVS